MKVKFKCSCVGINPGDYTNQIWVHAPAHMPKENGYCLDRCIAEEVMQLWMLGIKTTGCCCGHRDEEASYIGVEEDNDTISFMRMMGYENRENKLRPGAKDSFIPTGHKNLSRIFGGKEGIFVLQVKKEDSGEWKDYLKYSPSKIGPIRDCPNKRIVYYPHIAPKDIPYTISYSLGEGKLEELNHGPPITNLKNEVKFNNAPKIPN